MYVACPSCKSLYTLTADQLRQAAGQVRCGQCQTRFNAAQAAFQDPRQALAFEPPLQQELVQEIDELVDRALDQVPGQGGLASGPRDSRTIPAVTPEPPGGAIESAALTLCADVDHYAQPVNAEFTTPVRKPGADELPDLSTALMFDDDDSHVSRTSWGAIAAALLLTLALVGQYAYWDRYRLAQISALRPALEWLCAPLECDLPLRRDLARLEMIEREVRDHPRVDGALLVGAAFVNRAPYPQAYPMLQISFSDVAGTPVAVRRFTPEEYLRKKKAATGIAPGEQALVMLEVVDPGERAVSFQFDFM